jgi:phosphoserine phosphatase
MRIKLLLFSSLLFVLASCREEQTESSGSPSDDSSETLSATDALPSWNPTPNLHAIVSFVASTTDSTAKSFIAREDRIAVFDNDGTLWSEQPAYFQLFFAIDQVKALAPKHPEWDNEEPMKSVLSGDFESVKKQGLEGVLQLVMATHAGMWEEEFHETVRQWADTAKHPETELRFIDMVYQPMLELLQYLRSNGYKTYIVSGGGVSFMRAWATDVYGIPAEQILGSTLQTGFVSDSSGSRVIRKSVLDFIDDKEGKPENINKVIGKKPAIAFGNSDGDFAMLDYTSSRDGLALSAMIHHTDSIREYAYDREGHIGVLVKGLDEAADRGWLLIDMAKDWKTVYPEQ